jgi:hypothetical protein
VEGELGYLASSRLHVSHYPYRDLFHLQMPFCKEQIKAGGNK